MICSHEYKNFEEDWITANDLIVTFTCNLCGKRIAETFTKIAEEEVKK